MNRICLALGLMFLAAPAYAQTPTIPPRGNAYFDNPQDGKILGGVEAPPGSYPWQVSLQRADWQAHYCGASIRTDRWLITAAHCMINLNPADILVVAGTQTIAAQSPRLRVEQILVNKKYDASTFDNDIALVKLQQPLVLGANVQPIPPISASEEQTLGNKSLFVTGWGATQEGGAAVKTLREVAVPLVSNKDCSDPLAYGSKITDRMLCAGLAQGGKDSCQGDSGGPLATGRDGSSRLVGIVSWGEGCGKPGKPGVYSRVSVLNAWVEACLANPSSCQ
jgi:secreted trypsin-like serine protease